MTVQELIAELSKMPPDMTVAVKWYSNYSDCDVLDEVLTVEIIDADDAHLSGNVVALGR
jgi:hypothetical protein